MKRILELFLGGRNIRSLCVGSGVGGLWRLLCLGLLSMVIAGCSGGEGDDGGGSDPGPAPAPSTAAEVEARRIGAIYRYMQGLGGLMLANLSEVDVGETRAGSQPCSGGGSVSYTDTSTSATADPSAAITFNNCVEEIGVVSGTMHVRNFLLRLDADGSGDFNVSWSVDVVVDGYAMRFENSSGRTTRFSDGSVRIESFGGSDLSNVMTAPNGQSVQFSDVRMDVQYAPSTGVSNLGGSNVRMRHVSEGNRTANLLPSDLRADTVEATGFFTIAAPNTGTVSYQRSFDPTGTDVRGNGVTRNGLLDLTIEPITNPSFSGSAGQYAWANLIANPELSLPATPP